MHLSPELVLVAPPELARLERLALPDRPWEHCGTASASDVQAPGEDGAPPLRLDGDDVATTQAALAPAPAPPPPSPEPSRGSPATRAQTALGTEQAQDEPTPPGPLPGVANPPRRSGAVGRRSDHARLRVLASKTLTAAVVLVTTLVAVTWASGRTVSPGLAPATGRTGEATAFHVLPGGGYLFDGGHLRVAADGRSIDEIELTTLCTRRVSLRALPIAADGRFGYAGPPAAGGGHAVVSGRFRSSGTATMRLALDVEGCPPRPLTVEARIS